MAKPRTKEYKAFTEALGKVLSVSHNEMKKLLEDEKKQKGKKLKTKESSRQQG